MKQKRFHGHWSIHTLLIFLPTIQILCCNTISIYFIYIFSILSLKSNIKLNMSSMTSIQYVAPSIIKSQHKKHSTPRKLLQSMINNPLHQNPSTSLPPSKNRDSNVIRCINSSGRTIGDFIGGDLLKLDIGKFVADVEEHKAIAIYTPHEGGYEGRYLTRLRYQGYEFLEITARGLGDPETTLTKVHPVCPPHVGKQPIVRWWYPPEVDYRLDALPPDAKGLVVWIIEAKVLSKAELQFIALLPSLRPKVRVVAECGNWRKVIWKPLKEISGLSPLQET